MSKLILIALTLFSLSANASLIDVELVTNGDAESGNLFGWNSNGIELIDVSLNPVTPGTNGLVNFNEIGTYSFTGATGATFESMSQLIDLSGLNAGLLFYNFSGLVQSRISPNNGNIDTGLITLSFLDINNSVIDLLQFTDPVIQNEFDWTSHSIRNALPEMTNKVLVEVSISRSGGFSNDGFFDNLSFKLSKSATSVPVNEPSHLVLLYLCLLFHFRRKVFYNVITKTPIVTG